MKNFVETASENSRNHSVKNSVNCQMLKWASEGGGAVCKEKRKRGVTLFIVLALMTMFAMLVVAFMIITTQARRQAEHMAKNITDPKNNGQAVIASNFDKALEKLLIGDQLESVLGPHSILENLYGNPTRGSDNTDKNLSSSIAGNIGQNNNYIELHLAQPINFDQWYFDRFEAFDLFGNVLTVTEIPNSSDPARNERLRKIKGKSTFIISFDPGSVNFIFNSPIHITPFPDVTLIADDLKDCRVIINSAAFSGTGPGINTNNAAAGEAALKEMDKPNPFDSVPSKPFALRPNVLAPGGTQPYKTYLENNIVLMNPDYTAPDYLNMFLAWNNVQWNTMNNKWGLGNPADPSSTKIIPSFHRPQLVRYWFEDLLSTNPLGLLDPQELRKVVLRPLQADHPNFTGSNPAANDTPGPVLNRAQKLFNFLTKGPWDVDNDGDGIADGIWIDAGLGTTTMTGKTYKKLVSYYVLDMDGRVNVNVHGNSRHDANFDTVSDTLAEKEYGGLKLRGSGSGPAEVRLDLAVDTVTGTPGDGSTVLNKLLISNTANSEGRYGVDAVPGDNAIFPSTTENVIWWGKELMGINPQAYAGYHHDSSYRTFSGLGENIPDWWGELAMQFDPLGNRHFGMIYPQNSALHLNTLYKDNPYLMNPYNYSGYDRLFDPNDLQSLIRNPSDVDYTAQSQRLRTLLESPTSPLVTSSPYRFFFTTRSSDIPVTNNFNAGVYASGSYKYFTKGLFSYIHNKISNKISDSTRAIYTLLPEEIRRGERINLNRLTLLSDWQKIPTNPAVGVNSRNVLEEKANFAREIFYLLLVLNYDRLYDNHSGQGTMTYGEGSLTREQIIARLAQWSVNLVDFIDPDDVMTPLLYSTSPFDTDVLQYFISNNPTTQIYNNNWTPPTGGSSVPYRIAWGMEKPEVAITETFALHNRRVADSIKPQSDVENACSDSSCTIDQNRIEPAGHTCSGTHDTDFDQVMVPQGSLFVELYRQGNPARVQSFPNGNALTGNNPDGPPNLSLSQRVGANGSYVWRLAISEKNCGSTPEFDWNTGAHDQDALYQLKSNGNICSFQTQQWPTITTISGCFDDDTDIVPERIIWFGIAPPTSQAGTDDSTIAEHSYYCLGGKSDLEPNQYLLITPNEHNNVTQSRIELLSKPVDGTNPDFGTDATQKIYVSANGISINGTTAPFNSTNPPKTPPQLMFTGTPHPEDSNYRISVSVSEPLPNSSYYPLNGLDSATGRYSPALEHPLDTEELESYGTIPCYRTICLQRLADPSRQHHPMTNPYITVDWNMIDLHVINSEKDTRGSDDPIFADAGKHGDLYLNSRQWGTVGMLGGDNKKHPNLWARNFSMTAGATNEKVGYLDVGNAQINGAVALDTSRMTLGYLNKYPNVNLIQDQTLTNLAPAPNLTFTIRFFRGAPDTAFLHFPWHNAPLTNSYELMLIPASSPDRFGVEFYDNETTNWVNTATAESLGSGLRYSNPNGGLGPYLNFFGGDLNLSRLFEYVRVPSKFGGTIRGWVTDNSGNLIKPIYEMREPGKINLNTATAPVWEALQGSIARTNWHEYTNSNDDGLYALRHKEAIDNVYPSEFVPFRSPQATVLVPPLKTSGHENDLVQQNPANTTLLRTNLLEPEPDADNPYTALESYMRLSDMTTTRSNVFAVWMTIGYFEVEHFSSRINLINRYSNLAPYITTDDTFKAVYPDGYVLGAEKGLNDGTVKRHRAFYLLDRSTPVGFRRGEVYRQENGDPHYKPVIVSSKTLE
ncbi:MAG: hypothetical protein LBK82_12420 [Planctomycetaceae bacterium]|jgi:hypothetical protein|nr:hypothetical protein [Planctomycetaceae bacterium]